MAGEATNQNVRAAARAGAMQAGAMRRIADAFSPDPGVGLTLEQYQQMLDQAGHKVGAGFDGCQVCLQFAGMLPDLIQQLLAQQQQPPQG